MVGFVLLIAFQLEANQPNLPEPIKVKRGGGKLVVPKVDRDKLICFALYTVQKKVLKMSAFAYPLQKGEDESFHLHINQGQGWKKMRSEKLDRKNLQITYRIEKWNHDKKAKYKITHKGGTSYEGVIRADPKDKEEIVVAAFTGNSNSDRGPKPDIIKNIESQDPDLLFFSGDQSYDHNNHKAAWLLFGRQFGEIIKDRPTVTIPDDHDVGQGNLWGAGGKKSNTRYGPDGGYVKSASYVNSVQKAQTWHLPDPFDPTPVQQNISVYYTSLNVGGIDFAIIEDRKWKTGPEGLNLHKGKRADHVNDPEVDPASLDVPQAVLLGERQLKFLKAWGEEWGDATMKAVLSQTIFAGGAHIHGKYKGRLRMDLDSNGWPQGGRNKALGLMRRCYAFHIAGDQHLATVIHHGINDWEDAAVSFCVPSIVNYYGRWWWPLEDPEGRVKKSDLPFTGRYYDGFKNKVTMHAYANPTTANQNGAGYGLIRFNKKTRDIKMECWPRSVDVSKKSTRQYPGWPVSVHQFDNAFSSSKIVLPKLLVKGRKDSVVKIYDEKSGDLILSLRINGDSFQPRVGQQGLYKIVVESDGKTKTFEKVKASSAAKSKTISVSF